MAFGRFGVSFNIFEALLSPYLGHSIMTATIGGGLAGAWLARGRLLASTSYHSVLGIIVKKNNAQAADFFCFFSPDQKRSILLA
jgi:hypothetical protein